MPHFFGWDKGSYLGFESCFKRLVKPGFQVLRLNSMWETVEWKQLQKIYLKKRVSLPMKYFWYNNHQISFQRTRWPETLNGSLDLSSNLVCVVHVTVHRGYIEAIMVAILAFIFILFYVLIDKVKACFGNK